MLPYSDSRITKIALTLFFLVVVGYAFYESYGLVSGPSMTISDAPIVVHDPFVRIQGSAERISGLAMNGKDIPVTAAGAFDEPYLLAPGRNRIMLIARDRYGHTSQNVVEITYMPSTLGTSTQTATTTPKSIATSTSSIEKRQ